MGSHSLTYSMPKKETYHGTTTRRGCDKWLSTLGHRAPEPTIKSKSPRVNKLWLLTTYLSVESYIPLFPTTQSQYSEMGLNV